MYGVFIEEKKLSRPERNRNRGRQIELIKGYFLPKTTLEGFASRALVFEHPVVRARKFVSSSQALIGPR